MMQQQRVFLVNMPSPEAEQQGEEEGPSLESISAGDNSSKSGGQPSIASVSNTGKTIGRPFFLLTQSL